MSGMDRIDVELDRREADELAELEELREREAPAFRLLSLMHRCLPRRGACLCPSAGASLDLDRELIDFNNRLAYHLRTWDPKAWTAPGPGSVR